MGSYVLRRLFWKPCPVVSLVLSFLVSIFERKKKNLLLPVVWQRLVLSFPLSLFKKKDKHFLFPSGERDHKQKQFCDQPQLIKVENVYIQCGTAPCGAEFNWIIVMHIIAMQYDQLPWNLSKSNQYSRLSEDSSNV